MALNSTMLIESKDSLTDQVPWGPTPLPILRDLHLWRQWSSSAGRKICQVPEKGYKSIQSEYLALASRSFSRMNDCCYLNQAVRMYCRGLECHCAYGTNWNKATMIWRTHMDGLTERLTVDWRTRGSLPASKVRELSLVVQKPYSGPCLGSNQGIPDADLW